MFNWLFGKSSSAPKPPLQQSQKKWKYQALLQFLVSKEWKNTLLNFIDNNCIVFDNQQENKFQYTIIHNKFKELVAGLFDSVMEELGMGPELLVEMMERGFKSSGNSKVFEQLHYVDDFMKFKEMMLKRNARLEEEALQELARSQMEQSGVRQSGNSNSNPNSSSSIPDMGKNEEEEEMLRKIMELSLKEEEERSRIRESKIKEEEGLMENVMHQSKLLEMERSEEKARELELLRNAEKESELERIRELKEKNQKLELKKRQEEERLMQKELQRQREEQERVKEEQAKLAQQKQELPPQPQVQKLPQLPPNPKPIDPQSVEQRKRRLLQQRQILRKKKMEERSKEEGKHFQTIVLGASGVHEASDHQEGEEKISQNEIERRRELMKRIKNKIVEDY